jgi:hypothetical protein
MRVHLYRERAVIMLVCGMAAYSLRRLIQLVPVLLLISFLVFMLIHIVPRDPVAALMGEGNSNPVVEQALRTRLGLDRSRRDRHQHSRRRHRGGPAQSAERVPGDATAAANASSAVAGNRSRIRGRAHGVGARADRGGAW